jgi:hypothetical protein
VSARGAAAFVLAVAAPALAVGAPLPAGGTSYRTGDPAVDGLQALVAQTLEANRKTFAGRTGTVKGFGAGTTYPQIWIRDSATLLPLTRWHYDRAHLASWLEEHLAHQNADGSLHDWVAAGDAARFRADAPRAREVHRAGGIVLSADRNTTESDQESSAVVAARIVFDATRDVEWLRKPVAGRAVVDRLDAALSFVAARRMSGGLVTAAFTADWGDVSPVYADQRVIYLDEATPVVAGLYASALYARAARGLADMHRAAGAAARAARWAARSQATAAAINRRLWQPRRGFYRLHVPIASPPGWRPPDDGDVFALGGNTLAALYGIADGPRAARLMDVAERRRREYGLSTIGGVLLPPYPAGFFRHPILREPFTYQNGGQWDWWAGRFALAEFERGHAVRAMEHLRALAARAMAAGGLHEWSTRDGHGRGSPRYAGSAAALGAAVLQGLFGLDLGDTGLALHVRLGARSGEVRAHEPATGTTVAYRQAYDAKARLLHLAFESSAPGTGRVEVLLPPGATPVACRVDGRRRALPMVRAVGEDRYAVVRTDWKPHALELALR